MKAISFVLLSLAACAPRVEVTLLSLTGGADPLLSRVYFVMRAGDRSATSSTRDVQLPRIETMVVPESFDGEPLKIEAIAFIGDKEVGRGAVELLSEQKEATLLFPVCSNASSEAEELCDDGNLTDGDGCDSTCKPTGCNSGVLTPGEICFAPQSDVIANASPSEVSIEDIDNDGLLDLIALYPSESKARIFFARADNFFGTFLEIDLGLNLNANRLFVADLNQDGFLDLVAGNTTVTATFLNQGDSTFKPGQRSLLEAVNLRDLALVDLDGDQIPEKIELDFGQSRVLSQKGLGDGTFDISTSPSVTFVGTQPIALSIVDIDQDGDNDTITANLSGSISVLLNNAGTLTQKVTITTTGTPLDLTTADFDGDGLLDIAAIKQARTGFVSIFRQDASENFQGAGDFAVPDSPGGLIAADVDLDRDIDLAVTNESGATVTILINNGLGQFTPLEATIPTTTLPRTISAGDINRDGLLDFVTAGQDLGLIFSTP